ncbi:hypothetical protein JCGZ_04289 [Jatropha curcas]|uniref:EF-hand domain-containing protein n=1 Tax=Jatropha curcas TaxID=180498 RepID=A0A067L2N5_JATCU|nr:hypothetical protein JCGZ_04289 [Jatropha curcas]
MACRGRYIDATPAMTKEEFKKWLKRFDTNRDGRISTVELLSAVRSFGGWFGGVQAWWRVRGADANSDGYIDDDELDNLIDFAQKHLGVRVSRN